MKPGQRLPTEGRDELCVEAMRIFDAEKRIQSVAAQLSVSVKTARNLVYRGRLLRESANESEVT